MYVKRIIYVAVLALVVSGIGLVPAMASTATSNRGAAAHQSAKHHGKPRKVKLIVLKPGHKIKIVIVRIPLKGYHHHAIGRDVGESNGPVLYDFYIQGIPVLGCVAGLTVTAVEISSAISFPPLAIAIGAYGLYQQYSETLPGGEYNNPNSDQAVYGFIRGLFPTSACVLPAQIGETQTGFYPTPDLYGLGFYVPPGSKTNKGQQGTGHASSGDDHLDLVATVLDHHHAARTNGSSTGSARMPRRS